MIFKHTKGVSGKMDVSRKRRGRHWTLVGIIYAVCLAPLACLLSATASGSKGSRPAAGVARTVTVRETAHLHVTSHRGLQLLNEAGEGTGTFRCPLTVHLSIAYTEAHISFTLACSSRDSLSGSGNTSFYVSGSTAHFSGSVGVTRGTGRYAHASASHLSVNGSFQRSSYALSLSVSGSLHV
jgi:hypothetical protein